MSHTENELTVNGVLVEEGQGRVNVIKSPRMSVISQSGRPRLGRLLSKTPQFGHAVTAYFQPTTMSQMSFSKEDHRQSYIFFVS
jgi:hypothetical protein